MKIGGLQRTSLSDYPGKISAIVFTQGCNFRCPYCHNPELVDPGKFGPLVPEGDFFAFLEKRQGKLDAVTVTGGEPTLQEDLERFLSDIRKMGYHLKLDTNGSRPDVLESLIGRGLVDYFAMDIKGPFSKYNRIAGVSVAENAIRKSIELIATSGISHEFRTTIVRSQLDADDLVSIVDLLKNTSLYVLQAFVPTKLLAASFLSETTYSPDEFAVIRERLEKEGLRIAIR